MHDGARVFALDQVSKSYDGNVVLQPLDFVTERAQTTVLIGPSGCGKSTLMRLMMGLIVPSSGTVTFGDRTLHGDDRDLEARRQMGYVTQNGGLFPHLSAFDNVAMMARFVGWKDDRIRERVAELGQLAHLSADAVDRFPHELSGGQRQRVSLMRALMLDPDAILLDEPMGALDPLVRAELQNDLRAAFRSLGKTVVMVTHDLAEAAYFGDTIVLLRDGRIEQTASYPELLNQPASEFVTEFVHAQRGHNFVPDDEPQLSSSQSPSQNQPEKTEAVAP